MKNNHDEQRGPMKKIISLLLLFACASAQPVFAETASKPTQEEPVPEALQQWEQENIGREVAEDERYGELWNKTLMLLIVVLLVLFAGTWYLKKFGGLKTNTQAADSRIQILERRPLSPKAILYLISIDGHKIAISETPTGISVLQELSQIKPFSLQEKAH